MKTKDWTHKQLCHWIAQTVINIEEGYAPEPGSVLHHALVELCERLSDGRIIPSKPDPEED